MKSIIKYLFIICLIFGMTNNKQAEAVEFRTGASFHTTYALSENVNNTNYITQYINQRMQFGMTWLANDNLYGGFMARVPGEMSWGNSADGTVSRSKSFDNGTYLALKTFFINWKVPTTETQVRMGLQWFRLPGYMGRGGSGSPVYGEYTAGVRIFNANAITNLFAENDSVMLDFFWMRPFAYTTTTTMTDYYIASAPGTVGRPTSVDGEYNETGWDFDQQIGGIDAWTFSFVYKSDLVDVTPYVMAAHFDGDTYLHEPGLAGRYYTLNRRNAFLYWAGITNQFKIDKLRFGIEGLYSGHDRTHRHGGFVVNTYARYILDSFTPGFTAWYANGTTKNKVAGMIAICDGGWPTDLSNYFGRGYSLGGVTAGAGNPNGTAGFTLEAGNIQPIDKLLIIATFLGVMGTNHKDYTEPGATSPYNLNSASLAYLTTEDYLLNLTITTKYSVTPKLHFWLETAGYYFNFGRDGATKRDPGYVVHLISQYNF